ncbi:hypothetical protein GW17_00010543 [Ensete ventricosum]|nr:hypothetical protein GW17_00010543 [Ensete ventricosum]
MGNLHASHLLLSLASPLVSWLLPSNSPLLWSPKSLPILAPFVRLQLSPIIRDRTRHQLQPPPVAGASQWTADEGR